MMEYNEYTPILETLQKRLTWLKQQSFVRTEVCTLQRTLSCENSIIKYYIFYNNLLSMETVFEPEEDNISFRSSVIVSNILAVALLTSLTSLWGAVQQIWPTFLKDDL